MKRSVMYCIVLLTVVLLFTGCGSPDATSDGLDSGFITAYTHTFLNAPPDLTANACTLNLGISFSTSITQAAIDTIKITSESGITWTLPAASLSSSAFSTGNVQLQLAYSKNNQDTFPLGGVWTMQIRLKDGRTALIRARLHEPGTLNPAAHGYVYAAEDWTPTVNQSEYVPLLGRFPTEGVALTYSAGDGGGIRSSGFATANSGYLTSSPNAYNFFCVLYDSEKRLVGETTTAYSAIDHSLTGLTAPDGELEITAATDSNTNLDLSTVKYVRIAYQDGGQYPLTGMALYQDRSLSQLIPVM